MAANTCLCDLIL